MGTQLAARVGVVDGAGGHFLARAGLPQQEDRQAGAGGLLNQPANGIDLRGLAQQAVRKVRNAGDHEVLAVTRNLVGRRRLSSHRIRGEYGKKGRWRLPEWLRFPPAPRQTPGFSGVSIRRAAP